MPSAGRLISNDKKNLTLKNVCKDCATNNSLMNVQCLAKNIHGSIIADGYLNVLSKSLPHCLSYIDGNTYYYCSEGFDRIFLQAYGRYMNYTCRDQKIVYVNEHCKLDIRKYFFSHRMTNDLSKLSADCVNVSSVNVLTRMT